jgi:4-hydroxybenzoate polyprenyltransferase
MRPPLCVDLDGTLVRTDTLVESLLELARTRTLALLQLPVWLAGGKARLKARVAERVTLTPDVLPYREDVVAWLRAEAAERPVWLVTAAHRSIAEPVATHLGIFAGVMSTEGVNLSAERKASALCERFGSGGFDYAGNSSDDEPVWRAARAAILVGAPAHVVARVRAEGKIEREFPARDAAGKARLLAWVRELRLYQWVKNLLLFVAPLAAHRLADPATLGATAAGFIAFCLAASAVYLINDLIDLGADRAHPRKRHRPFARGDLPAAHGLVAAPLLLAAAAALGAQLGTAFLAVLATYVALTTLYSFWLKRKLFIDVGTLACLYTLRVVAGAAAGGFAPSFWLLALCAYGFLSLALLKRYSELIALPARGPGPAAGRGYLGTDAPVVLALGAGSGLAATLVMALYVDSESSQLLYRHPEFLWSLVGLMTLGIGRLWLKAGRGLLTDDPIVYIARDRFSLVLVAAAVAAVYVAV